MQESKSSLPLYVQLMALVQFTANKLFCRTTASFPRYIFLLDIQPNSCQNTKNQGFKNHSHGITSVSFCSRFLSFQFIFYRAEAALISMKAIKGLRMPLWPYTINIGHLAYDRLSVCFWHGSFIGGQCEVECLEV